MDREKGVCMGVGVCVCREKQRKTLQHSSFKKTKALPPIKHVYYMPPIKHVI